MAATVVKTRPPVPVSVVEDHDEALAVIYRAMGSKKLPLSGVTLIHFDAHPDLLSPGLPADEFTDKEKLFAYASIAEWILPAVYMQHIDCVVWVKPPWSSQIEEGEHRLVVGREDGSGHVRVATRLAYFISDQLYAPSDTLTNIRDIPLYVVTLPVHEPSLDTTGQQLPGQQLPGHQSSGHQLPGHRSSGQQLPGHQSSGQQLTGHQSSGQQLSGHQSSGQQLSGHQSLGQQLSGHQSSGQQLSGHQSSETSVNGNDQTVEGCGVVRCDQQTVSDKACESVCSPTSPEAVGVEGTGKVGKSRVESGRDDLSVSEGETAPPRKRGRFSEPHPSLMTRAVGVVSEVLRGCGSWILDIDLDFFSTANPFNKEFSHEEYSFLERLYKFQEPLNNSKESLAECVEEREEQLDSLLDFWSEEAGEKAEWPLHTGEEKELVSAVKAKIGKIYNGLPFEAEDVHMAGMMTDLPHHIASQSEMKGLEAATTHFLRTAITSSPAGLPALVTIARSAEDGYTPAHHVEQLMEDTVAMVTHLCGNHVEVRHHNLTLPTDDITNEY